MDLQKKNKKKLIKNSITFTYFEKLPYYCSIVSLILFLLQSCSGNYCTQITSIIKEKYKQTPREEIVLDLSQVFEFEWDILYICGPYGFEQELSSTIGFDSQYSYVEEGETLLAFVKGDKVVEEKLISCEYIGFVNSNEAECFEIKNSDSKLIVKKISGKDQNYMLRKN